METPESIRTFLQQGDFVGYQFDLKQGWVRPTPDRGQTLQVKIQKLLFGLACPAADVPHWTTNSHRKTGPPRSALHETDTVALDNIPGRLNMVVDKLSRLGQTILKEWSLLPEVFQLTCNRWHQPQIDLFAIVFNNKLPQFMSLFLDSLVWAVGALSLS